jgi:hypothetical protein
MEPKSNSKLRNSSRSNGRHNILRSRIGRKRDIRVLKATPLFIEELEDTQMNLQTMLTMRHMAPF